MLEALFFQHYTKTKKWLGRKQGEGEGGEWSHGVCRNPGTDTEGLDHIWASPFTTYNYSFLRHSEYTPNALLKICPETLVHKQAIIHFHLPTRFEKLFQVVGQFLVLGIVLKQMIMRPIKMLKYGFQGSVLSSISKSIITCAIRTRRRSNSKARN